MPDVSLSIISQVGTDPLTPAPLDAEASEHTRSYLSKVDLRDITLCLSAGYKAPVQSQMVRWVVFAESVS